MKKIGLIGGLSWESTQVYYQIMNQKVNNLLGGSHSCKLVLESLDFSEVEKLQHEDDWQLLDELMIKAAHNLEKAGAEIIVLCTNTMHLSADKIIENISVPFLHIADATGQEIAKNNIEKVLLLGTKFTMEKDFYKEFLKTNYGITVIIPDKEDRLLIHKIIYEELIYGTIKTASKNTYLDIIKKATQQGVQGVILGCTEIPLLINEEDVEIKVFDTTKIHAEHAVNKALS